MKEIKFEYHRDLATLDENPSGAGAVHKVTPLILLREYTAGNKRSKQLQNVYMNNG